MTTEVQEPETTAEVELEGKEALYAKISEFVKEKTGKRIGKTGGQQLFNMVCEGIFSIATGPEKTVRLNGGLGSFHVKEYQAGSRTLPSGQVVEFGERTKLRYEEGVLVKEMLTTGGDIIAARKARSASKEEVKPVAKEKPSSDQEGKEELD